MSKKKQNSNDSIHIDELDPSNPMPKFQFKKDNQGCENCRCSEVANMELEIELLKKQSNENLERAKYERAELENFRRRNADNASRAYIDGQSSVVTQILPIGDTLTEAIKNAKQGYDTSGIEILLRKFDETLESLGVEEIPALGQPFDPNVHNAVSVGECKKSKPDTVLEVWQRGYKLHGKVIRPSAVKVSS